MIFTYNDRCYLSHIQMIHAHVGRIDINILRLAFYTSTNVFALEHITFDLIIVAFDRSTRFTANETTFLRLAKRTIAIFANSNRLSGFRFIFLESGHVESNKRCPTHQFTVNILYILLIVLTFCKWFDVYRNRYLDIRHHNNIPYHSRYTPIYNSVFHSFHTFAWRRCNELNRVNRYKDHHNRLVDTI